MRSTHPRLRFALLFTMALAAALIPSAASGQCTITGPTTLCNGPATLCGPNGTNWEYVWQGPNGSMGQSQCITVTEPGTYSLTLFDMVNGGMFGPCSQTVVSSNPPACSITGPTAFCQGTSVELCGPTGSFDYTWSGPGGFSATTACISVTVGGSYQLVIRDQATGCTSSPCSQTVTFTTCGGNETVNCPRNARYWERQCELSGPSADLGGCVDSRAAIFSWGNPGASLCATLNPPQPRDLRVRAKRQFAALLANLCAGDLHMISRESVAIGLNADTQVNLEDLHTTIGAWAADADQQLVSLESRSLKDKNVKQAYRDIISVAFKVNHGQGIGPVCGGTSDARQATTFGDLPTEAWVDAESLAEELSEIGEPALSFELPTPNPTANAAGLAYVISTASDENVEIGIYDLNGRLVKQLVRERLLPGRYLTSWDGRGADGSFVRNGIYFVHGRLGTDHVKSRITLLR